MNRPKIDWQSIETAPKDGTQILATGHNYGNPEMSRHYAVVQWTERGWVDQEDKSDLWEDAEPPFPYTYLTHWSPLPEEP